MSELAGNPFIFVPPRSAVAAVAKPAEPPKPKVDDRKKQELSDALASVKALSLQSVLMGGRSAVAMISNNLLTEGQVIHGWRVTKIQSREVVLTWRDHTYVLKMPQ